MRPTRSLALKRETLTQLTDAEMSLLAGGTIQGNTHTPCIVLTPQCPSVRACPTVPLANCLDDTLLCS